MGELFTVARFVDENRLGPAYQFFHKHHVVDDHWKTLGYQRTDEIVRISPTAEQLEVHDGHMATVAQILAKRYMTEMDALLLQKRSGIVARLQDDPECRLILMTNPGSTGLNLQAANTVINVDLPWKPAVLEQRIARAYRMGQKNPVHLYKLVTTGTIEEKLLDTLASKQHLADASLARARDRALRCMQWTVLWATDTLGFAI
ncbi:helicase-related protein [Roseimaritima ulvae]|uniref:helicase-related protein n=1 Tax=Roseimaritima ulvae TaxID=980254 RepID=UPI0008309880|nr:C-terminal helicase domain-containing protein [Roseimaritima ulvae]